MKPILIGLLALTLNSTASFADNHDKCACDAKCSEACAKGEGQKCKCDTCDCAKTGQCSHKKCELHGKKEEKPKK